jgi:hypothetical protein
MLGWILYLIDTNTQYEDMATSKCVKDAVSFKADVHARLFDQQAGDDSQVSLQTFEQEDQSLRKIKVLQKRLWDEYSQLDSAVQAVMTSAGSLMQLAGSNAQVCFDVLKHSCA